MKKILFSLILFILLFPSVVFAYNNCNIVEGDTLEIGTEVACGDEHFYVLSINDDDVRLVTKYNIKDGASYYREKIPDDNTNSRYCYDVYSPLNGSQASVNTYKKNGYCTYYVNYYGNRIVTQDKDSAQDKWDEDGNLVFPSYSIKFLSKHSYSNDRVEADSVDYAIRYSTPKFRDFTIINYYISQSFENIVKQYKKSLEYNNYKVTGYSIVSLKDIETFVNTVSNKTFNYDEFASSIEENTTVDNYAFIDLKEYIPDKYSWIYNTSYWNKTIYNQAGNNNSVNNTNWNYIFVASDGKVHVSSFSEYKTAVGNGVRPIITMPKENIVKINPLGVTIQSIEYISRGGSVRINDDPTTDGTKIGLDLIFFDEGDYVEYDIVARNDTEKGLYINSDYITNDKVHIKYLFDSNYIESGETKTIRMKVFYDEPVASSEFDNGVYDASSDGPVVFSTQLINSPNTLKNLGIVFILVLIIVLVAIAVGIYLLIKNGKVNKNYLFLFVIVLILAPFSTKAFIRVDIPVKAKVLIKQNKAKPCTFEGNLVQGAIFVDGQYTYSYKQEADFDRWVNIDNDGWGVKLTNKNSTEPVNTELCSTINDKPIVSMRTMFGNARARKINMSSFDTSNVVNMYQMFYYIPDGITSIDVGYFDTSKVTNMGEMFYSDYTLEHIYELDRFNTSNVINFLNMFEYDYYLRNIKITNWDFSKAEQVKNMFYYVGEYAASIDFEIKNMNMPNVTDASYLFGYIGFDSITANVDIDGVTGDNVTNANGFAYNMAYNASTSNVNLQNISLKNASQIDDTFRYISASGKEVNINIKNIDLRSGDTTSGVFTYIGAYTKNNLKLNIENINLNGLKRAEYSFSNIAYSGVNVDINVNNIKMNSATTLYYMFSFTGEGVKDNFKLVYNNLEARSATDANNVFLYTGQTCKSTTIKIKNWDTPSLESAYAMFNHVGQSADDYLEIEIDNVDFSNVTNMAYMFTSVGESTDGTLKLKFKNINTPKLTTVEGMFRYFAWSPLSVTIEGLENFDFSKVTNFSDMFCYAVRTNSTPLDLGTIDIVLPASLNYLFYEFFSAKVVLNIRAVPTNISRVFNNVATIEGAVITLNYTAETESSVDQMIADSDPSYHIVKGVLLED